jgi:ABC-type transport system involved in multi-copper enzyme maturation permease subunit
VETQSRLRIPWNPLRPLLSNPVALKELRGRMRGPRAFIVLTCYLVVVGGFTWLLYLAGTAASYNTTGEVDGGTLGRALFGSVVAIELFLVTFITPAFTAGSVSGEHESQTYDLLRTTLLPERQFVFGKLFSALAYILLLLLAAIPLQSIAFLFGGVDLAEIVVSLVTLLSTAIFLGTIGIYYSATTRRTLRANILTYITVMAIILVTTGGVVVFLTIAETASNTTSTGTEWVLLLIQGFFICLNPLTTLLVTQNYLVNQQNLLLIKYTFNDGSVATLPSPWLVFTLIYLLLSAVFFVLTTRYLKRIEQ